MKEALVAVGVLAALAVVLLGTPRLLRSVPAIHGEARGISHLLSAVVVSVGLSLVDSRWLMVACGLLGVLFLIAAVELGLLGSMLIGSRLRDYGFVAYGVGFVVTVAVYMPHKEAVIAGLLTLGAADPMASFVGRRRGRRVIRSWHGQRTLEGAAAFMLTALAVSIGVLSVAGHPGALGFAVFVASTAAAIELITPSLVDNFAVPLWVGFLYLIAGHGQAALAVSWLPAVLLSGAGAALCVRLRWLDAAAAVGAFLVIAAALALGGLAWLAPMMAFFATTSVLTKIHASDAERRPRGLRQTLVNGIVPTSPLVVYVLSGRMLWYFLYVGAVAVASADTWASEVGRLLGSGRPVSLRNLRRVARGTSGAVTLVGTAASLLGGAIIGATAAAVAPGHDGLRLLLVGVVVGPLGMIGDSLLGAWMQCRYRCAICDGVSEKPLHCGRSGYPVAGVRGLTNDWVNLAANLLGALLVLPFVIGG